MCFFPDLVAPLFGTFRSIEHAPCSNDEPILTCSDPSCDVCLRVGDYLSKAREWFVRESVSVKIELSNTLLDEGPPHPGAGEEDALRGHQNARSPVVSFRGRETATCSNAFERPDDGGGRVASVGREERGGRATTRVKNAVNYAEPDSDEDDGNEPSDEEDGQEVRVSEKSRSRRRNRSRRSRPVRRPPSRNTESTRPEAERNDAVELHEDNVAVERERHSTPERFTSSTARREITEVSVGGGEPSEAAAAPRQNCVETCPSSVEKKLSALMPGVTFMVPAIVLSRIDVPPLKVEKVSPKSGNVQDTGRANQANDLTNIVQVSWTYLSS